MKKLIFLLILMMSVNCYALQMNVASQKWTIFAFDRTDNTAKTGDLGQITGSIWIDGVENVIGDTNPTELAHGYYEFDIDQAETNGDYLVMDAVSSTGNIQVVGAPMAVWTTAPAINTLAISNARVDVDVTAISTDATAANNLELFTEVLENATGLIDAGTFKAGAIDATAIAAAAIDNATFAADVGSTAYATNIIALAADKAGLNGTNVIQLGGVAQSLTDLKDFADAGYDPTNNITQSDLIYIHGTAINETSAGNIAGNFETFWDDGDDATDTTKYSEIGAILTDTGTTLDTLIKDIPTTSELALRTLLTADYVVVGDTIAGVTTVGTVTTNTDLVTAAAVKTAIEAGGSSLAQILADTGTDGVIVGAVNADAIEAGDFKTGAIDADALAADFVTEIWAKAMSDLAAVPAITDSVHSAINWMFCMSRNHKKTTTGGAKNEVELYKDDTITKFAESTVADDGTDFDSEEWRAPD